MVRVRNNLSEIFGSYSFLHFDFLYKMQSRTYNSLKEMLYVHWAGWNKSSSTVVKKEKRMIFTAYIIHANNLQATFTAVYRSC